MEKERKIFCIECRQETVYKLKRSKKAEYMKEKEYQFIVTEAFCTKCGAQVNPHGLIDWNVKEIDEQYRSAENIVTVKDIENLMELYNIGKAPLSLALGFGEVTITRYLMGQLPSKEYSDTIKSALESPDFMLEKLLENREKIGETAYKKAVKAAEELMPICSLSKEMLVAISYIFEKVEEVTPLALQKMLYYAQGVCMTIFNKELFPEECLAWEHGPVFRDVYDVFRSFKYSPIDDSRFVIFKNQYNDLGEAEKKVIETVVDSFGLYSGKTLERLTHNETPWQDAYEPCFPFEQSKVISKESIKDYFKKVQKSYRLDDAQEIKSYIRNQLSK